MIDPSVFSSITFPLRAATNSASVLNLPVLSLHSRANASSPPHDTLATTIGRSHFRDEKGRFMSYFPLRRIFENCPAALRWPTEPRRLPHRFRQSTRPFEMPPTLKTSSPFVQHFWPRCLRGKAAGLPGILDRRSFGLESRRRIAEERIISMSCNREFP